MFNKIASKVHFLYYVTFQVGICVPTACTAHEVDHLASLGEGGLTVIKGTNCSNIFLSWEAIGYARKSDSMRKSGTNSIGYIPVDCNVNKLTIQ